MADPDETRVLLDVMMGGLTSVLRMVGYDTVYALNRNAETDEAVRAIARAEDRVIVTRDGDIAASGQPTVHVESTDPDEQLRELQEAGFSLELDEPSRCSACNGALDRVREGPGPEDGPNPVEEPVWRCVSCGKHFWKGSHWDDVHERLASL